MIIWLIGLSGAGKTTIGKQLYRELKKKNKNIVYLDGDIMRDIWGESLGHDIKGRAKNAHRISNLCRLLDQQGIHVVVSVLSIFPNWQTWNRETFSEYFEVFVDVDLNVLIKRDPKGLYKKALNGEIKHVVGLDIKFPTPEQPDMVIKNNKKLINPEKLALKVLKKINERINRATVLEKKNEKEYPFGEGNLLEEPNNYFYSTFRGEEFLDSFYKSRMKAFCETLKIKDIFVPEKEPDLILSGKVKTKEILDWLVFQWFNGCANPDVVGLTNMMLKRFELSKRIYFYSNLDKNLSGSGNFKDYELYIRASELFVMAYRETNTIQYLNVLLKITDTISSFSPKLNGPNSMRFCNLIMSEQQFVGDLRLKGKF